MAKKKEVKKPNKREELETYLKNQLPGVFENEPAPAYAEGNFKKLVDRVIEILK